MHAPPLISARAADRLLAPNGVSAPLSTVRIDESTSQRGSAGPALFYHNNTWSSVCSAGFTDLSARMLCAEMGYPNGRALCCSAFGYSRYKVMNYTLQVGTPH